jgi:hypothetical protein
MLSVLVTGIVSFSAVWVYFDATKNQVGKREGENGFFNLSAGGWATVTLLLWIVGFPSYLAKRSSLIDAAKEAPAEASGRAAKLAVLSLVACLATGTQVAAMTAGGSLPECSSSDAVALAQQLIIAAPLNQARGVNTAVVSSGIEVPEQSSNERRVCLGLLTTELGQEPLKYSVSWQDRTAGRFLVQILAQ